MENNLKKLIETYQCPGCMMGNRIECFKPAEYGKQCAAHRPGTFISSIGKILLGMPKGFDRTNDSLGESKYDLKILEAPEYDKFNVAVWKHLDGHGNTLVRGLMPRLNQPFVHIYEGDQRDKISCLEITQEDINEMD